MQFRISSLIILALLFSILILIVACSTIGTTKPNVSHNGPYPDQFNQIAERNPFLVKEIGKLPEIRDGISESEAIALEKIGDLYEEEPESFDAAFSKMYQIGIPAVRKYCSPLQALFWLYVDLNDIDAQEVVQDYDLKKLLGKSWYSHNQSYKQKGKWLRSQAVKLFESCTDDGLKEQIDKYSKENPQFGSGLAVQYTFQQFRQNPDKFNYWFDESKFEQTQTMKNNRWNEYYEIVDRLNDPILLNWYINNNINYKFDHLNLGCQHPKTTFKRKSGCCVCIAKFGAYCLDRTGYKTSIRHLKRDSFNQHGVLVLKKKENYFIVVDFGGHNTMSGPFQSMTEVDKRIMDTIGKLGIEKKYIPKF